jgi:hypothetical protein
MEDLLGPFLGLGFQMELGRSVGELDSQDAPARRDRRHGADGDLETERSLEVEQLLLQARAPGRGSASKLRQTVLLEPHPLIS